jgi:hypothetical protein
MEEKPDWRSEVSAACRPQIMGLARLADLLGVASSTA